MKMKIYKYSIKGWTGWNERYIKIVKKKNENEYIIELYNDNSYDNKKNQFLLSNWLLIPANKKKIYKTSISTFIIHLERLHFNNDDIYNIKKEKELNLLFLNIQDMKQFLNYFPQKNTILSIKSIKEDKNNSPMILESLKIGNKKKKKKNRTRSNKRRSFSLNNVSDPLLSSSLSLSKHNNLLYQTPMKQHNSTSSSSSSLKTTAESEEVIETIKQHRIHSRSHSLSRTMNMIKSNHKNNMKKMEIINEEENINWNEQYQYILQLDEHNHEQMLLKSQQYHQFIKKFQDISINITKQIILERGKDILQRKISPLLSEYNDEENWVFYSHGLLITYVSYKLTNNNPKMMKNYDKIRKKQLIQDELLSKIATHDIIGIESYLNHPENILAPNKANYLSTCLYSLINYKGFRLLITAPFDINDHSALVYGKNDNDHGQFIYHDQLNQILHKLAHYLHLKTHIIDDQYHISTSSLIHIYQSKLRYYVTNLNYLYPIDLNFNNKLQANVLRPELLQNLNYCLNSDIYDLLSKKKKKKKKKKKRK